jgi:hypothetical protein
MFSLMVSFVVGDSTARGSGAHAGKEGRGLVVDAEQIL